MKHDQLRAVAHNIATSLSGCSFVTRIYDIDIGEALACSPSGCVTADFLRGIVDPPMPQTSFARAVALVPEALPAFCEKHGVSMAGFRELSARYWSALDGLRFAVVVTDTRGRRSETEYGDWNGKRTKVLDEMGRLRARPVRRTSR